MSNYVVQIIRGDGSVTYAGKESWSDDPQPTTVFSAQAAKGKALWWKKKACNLNVAEIQIKPVTILMDDEVSETIIPNC